MNLQRVTFSGSSKGRFMQISAACFHCEDTTNYLNSFIVLFSIAVPLSTASAYAASSSPNYFNVYSIILTISSFFSALSFKKDDLFNISFSIFIKLSIYDRSGTLRSIEIFSSAFVFSFNSIYATCLNVRLNIVIIIIIFSFFDCVFFFNLFSSILIDFF